jgi:hypothetical protein
MCQTANVIKYKDRETYVKLVDDRSHGIQDLGLSCIGNVAGIINQDSLHERGHHAGINHIKIIRLVHIGINELQDFFLDGPKSSDLGGLGCNGSYDVLIAARAFANQGE